MLQFAGAVYLSRGFGVEHIAQQAFLGAAVDASDAEQGIVFLGERIAVVVGSVGGLEQFVVGVDQLLNFLRAVDLGTGHVGGVENAVDGRQVGGVHAGDFGGGEIFQARLGFVGVVFIGRLGDGRQAAGFYRWHLRLGLGAHQVLQLAEAVHAGSVCPGALDGLLHGCQIGRCQARHAQGLQLLQTGSRAALGRDHHGGDRVGQLLQLAQVVDVRAVFAINHLAEQVHFGQGVDPSDADEGELLCAGLG